MKITALNETVTPQLAAKVLSDYTVHRLKFDEQDLEIARIYRAIARGKKIISVADAIRSAGLDSRGRPLLAVCRASAQHAFCRVEPWKDQVTFSELDTNSLRSDRPRSGTKIVIDWPNLRSSVTEVVSAMAFLPRIPPQYRPASQKLTGYHILWEADWTHLPRDPYLLKRIGKDAWVVLAAWDLTDVEMNVLRAHHGNHRAL